MGDYISQASGADVYCSHLGCERKVKNHAWGKTKADGWFFQKDGTAYCPDHVPGWVTEWRRRKKE